MFCLGSEVELIAFDFVVPRNGCKEGSIFFQAYSLFSNHSSESAA
jgi:hypothetical protein